MPNPGGENNPMNKNDFPKFTSIWRCPKCGYAGGDMLPTYHKANAAGCELQLDEEHLHRHCPRCFFGWAEACAEGEADR